MDVQRETDAANPSKGDGCGRAFGLRTLLLLVGVCAAVAWSVRVARDAAVPSYRWLHLLAEGDAEQRREAASNLGEVEGAIGATIRPRVAQALAVALADPDAEVAVAAARSLAPVIQAEPDDDAARGWSTALATGLRDPRVEVRRASAVGLGIPAPGKSSAAASDALAAALDDPDEEARAAVATALGRAGTGPRGIEALAKALMHDPATAVREASARSLALYPEGRDAATLALLRGLASDRPRARSESLTALLRRRTDRRGPSAAIVPALIATTSDADPAARACAASALGDVGPGAVAAVPALVARLGDPDGPSEADRQAWPEMRHRPWGPAVQAAEALARIAPGTPREAEAASALIAAIDATPYDPPRRFAFALALSNFSPPFAREAVRPLAGLLKENNPSRNDLRGPDWDGVCEILGRLAPGSPAEAEAVDALVQAMEYHRSYTSIQAADALGRMGPRAAASALPRLRAMRGLASESAPTLPSHVESAIRSIERGMASDSP
ncbi:MAG: hypothetical protein BGO49_07840 [Planctomycetales bacterium 71-10]|nr:MAG: hypothetical protein BGO49_07840 [Planctomycetales bacterium 71-10]